MNWIKKRSTQWYAVQVDEAEELRKYLDSHGYKVVNMVGGMNDWEGPLE